MKINQYSVEFNHCRLGILIGEPDFIVRAHSEGTGETLHFRCDSPAAIRIRLGIIDDGFARMLDPTGKLRYLLPQCFHAIGELWFRNLDSGSSQKFRARLPEAGCYFDDSILGRLFLLDFMLTDHQSS